MRISDWSSDVCSSDLSREVAALGIVVLKVHQGANGTASRHLAPAAAGRANRATAGRDGRMRDCAHAGRHLHAPVTRGRVMSIPALQRPPGAQIGSASCRAGGCKYVSISVVGGSLNKQKSRQTTDKTIG